MNVRHLPALATGLLLAAGALPAAAADAASAAPGWTGFYLGGQAGNLLATGSSTDMCIAGTLATTPGCLGGGGGSLPDLGVGDNELSGLTAGGYLGVNYRVDAIVLGLEGDINWDNARGEDSIPGEVVTSSTIGWDASLRARLGFLLDERALLYVTGGPGWLSTGLDSGLCADFRTSDPGARIDCGDSSMEFGWLLGAGAEFLLGDHLSLKAEYLHGWYGSADMNLMTLREDGGDLRYTFRQTLQTNVVRAGIAYHFGGL